MNNYLLVLEILKTVSERKFQGPGRSSGGSTGKLLPKRVPKMIIKKISPVAKNALAKI